MIRRILDAGVNCLLFVCVALWALVALIITATIVSRFLGDLQP